MADDLIGKFQTIFVGYEKAHGQHELFAQADETGKVKGIAQTVSFGAGRAQYEGHLKGLGTSLGLIPLMDDNTCMFGAIDVDIKGEVKLSEPIETLEARVRKLEMPLVVCQSKSGGAHLYLFGSQPISAKIMQAKLTEFSRILGYGGCEIFPKQVMRADERDLGNWINIAMYGCLDKKGTTRYALRNGKPIKDLKEFLKYIEAMRISQKALSEFAIHLTEAFADGPPCLQYLTTFGADSGRNIALTNVAIYYKIKDPDNWQDLVQQHNFDHLKPSLDSGEVSQIIKHILNKTYHYQCKQPPLCNHCDKKTCVKREFGVAFGNASSGDSLFPLDDLTRCVSKDSVRWYAEHDGCRVQLTTEQLLSPMELQRIFVEKFAKMIVPGKKMDWHSRLKEMLDTCTDVQDPDDASTQGQFENLLDNFFSASRPARNKDELIKGNSFTTEGRVYFRSEDLFNYLSVRRFNHKPHDIWNWLRSLGATATQLRIKGKLIRVWSLPEPERFDGSDIALPTQLTEEM